MTKKILVLASCFLFGTVLAQDHFYLRVDSARCYLICSYYHDHTIVPVVSKPDKNGGFVRIRKSFKKNKLKRIWIYGICDEVNNFTYRHYGQKVFYDGDLIKNIPVLIYNPESKKGPWRAVMRLEEFALDKIEELGGVCALSFCKSRVPASPAATFDVKKDCLPIKMKEEEFKLEEKIIMDKIDFMIKQLLMHKRLIKKDRAGMNALSETGKQESCDDNC